MRLNWLLRMVHASLLLLSYFSLPIFTIAFDLPVAVVETGSQPEIDVQAVVIAGPQNTVKKLKCHENKTASSVDDIVWQYKRCGYGLNLTACADLPKDAPWHLALCRNQTKLCTGATLPIVNPSASDSGFYRCLQKNYMMPKYRVNRTIQLDVRDFRSKSIEMVPEVEILDNQTVFENQTAVLRCRVRSTIYPLITWIRCLGSQNPEATLFLNCSPHKFLNDSVIHDGPDYLYTSKLYIQRARLEDAGFYHCLALGARDEVTKKVFLNVVPLVSHFTDLSSTDHGMWWFTVAMCFSVAVCLLVLLILVFQKRPKAILVPTDEIPVSRNSLF